ncbi:hypothetical protein [Caudoviricetes sp.]|nr:hypothetical protein [Caudoviricetes sp.]
MQKQPKTYKKSSSRSMRTVKRGIAQDAIGALEHNQDIYISYKS